MQERYGADQRCGIEFSVLCILKPKLMKHVMVRLRPKYCFDRIGYPRSSLFVPGDVASGLHCSEYVKGDEWMRRPRGRQPRTASQQLALQLRGQTADPRRKVWSVPQVKVLGHERRKNAGQRDQEVRVRKIVDAILAVLSQFVQVQRIVRRYHLSDIGAGLFTDRLPPGWQPRYCLWSGEKTFFAEEEENLEGCEKRAIARGATSLRGKLADNRRFLDQRRPYRAEKTGVVRLKEGGKCFGTLIEPLRISRSVEKLRLSQSPSPT
jgi:hypothetical protein